MRNEITSRPVLAWLIGLCLGLASGLSLLTLSLICALMLALQKNSVRLGTLAFCAIGVSLSLQTLPEVKNQYVEGRFRVETVPVRGRSSTTFLSSFESIRVQMRTEDAVKYIPGEVIFSRGRMSRLDSSRDEYLRAQGVAGRIDFAGRAAEVVGESPWWRRVPANLQTYCIRLTNILFGKENGAWVSAFCFNQEGALDSEEVLDLRRSGVYHLVSASGLHIGVLALALQAVLRLFSVKRGNQIWIVGLLLAVYTTMTGFHEATVRAAIMWVLGFSHYLFRRESDALNSLSVAGLGWLLFHPYDLFRPGFQLSYLVTLGLILYGGSFEEEGILARAGQVLRVSVVALLFSEPLIAWWFGQVNVISLVTNLLVMTASSAVLVLGLLAVIIGTLNLTVAQWVAEHLAVPLVGWIRMCVEAMSNLPWAVIQVDRGSTWLYAAYYSALVLMWRPTIRDVSDKARQNDPAVVLQQRAGSDEI